MSAARSGDLPPYTDTQRMIMDVRTRLLAQGCKSESEKGSCKYRGQNYTKCAIGWCISNKDYKPEMDNTSTYEYLGIPVCDRPDIMVAWRKNYPEALLYVAKALQKIHDNTDVSSWEQEFNKLGIDNALTPSEMASWIPTYI